MILAWKAPTDYPEHLVGSYGAEEGSYGSHDSNFNYLALSEGRPLPEGMDLPEIYLKAPARTLHKMDCLWLLGGIPLVSATLADFLDKTASSAIELIQPKTIYAAGIQESAQYFVLNVVCQADVVDQDRSDAEYDDEGNIIYFNEIFLQPGNRMDHSLAREATSHDLLISQSLAEKITQSGFNRGLDLGFYSINRRYVPFNPDALS